MKNWLILGIMLPLFAMGCRSGLTTDGKSCYELSSAEKDHLITYTRATLLQQKKTELFRPRELGLIERYEPTFTVTYTGDKLGEAVVVWRGPTRDFGMRYYGNLAGGKMSRSFISLERSASVIDYSGKLSPGAKKQVEKIVIDPNAPARLQGIR